MGLEMYYRAFLDLTSSRQMAAGLGPISYMTMIEYCDQMEIEGEQREDFIWLLQRVDQKYLEWSRTRVKSQ